MKAPFFRTPFNYDVMEVSDATGLGCADESMAVQSSAGECDINVIVERFLRTGVIPQVLPPLNIEFAEAMDFREAMDLMRAAQESFMDLPAKVRSEFDNDPVKFVDFCSDSKNLPRMRELGLAVPEPVAPVPAPA